MSEEEKKDKRFRLYSNLAIVGIVAAVLWMIFAPFWLTGQHNTYDMVNTGPIGDTIGGIAAPAVGLLSSILVYLSFRAQIRANEKIQDQIKIAFHQTNFEYMQNEHTLMLKKIDGFASEFKGHRESVQAITDLNKWTHEIIENITDPKQFELLYETYKSLEFLMFELKHYTDQVRSELNLSKEHRKILGIKIYLVYIQHLSNEIEVAVNSFDKDRGTPLYGNEKVHGAIKVLIEHETKLVSNMETFRKWLHNEEEPK